MTSCIENIAIEVKNQKVSEQAITTIQHLVELIIKSKKMNEDKKIDAITTLSSHIKDITITAEPIFIPLISNSDNITKALKPFTNQLIRNLKKSKKGTETITNIGIIALADEGQERQQASNQLSGTTKLNDHKSLRKNAFNLLKALIIQLEPTITEAMATS